MFLPEFDAPLRAGRVKIVHVRCYSDVAMTEFDPHNYTSLLYSGIPRVYVVQLNEKNRGEIKKKKEMYRCTKTCPLRFVGSIHVIIWSH